MGDEVSCACTHEEEIILLKDHVKDIGADTKLVLKLLRGNGEPGIMGKMLLQDQCLKKLHKRLDEHEESFKEYKKEIKEEIEKIKDKIDGSMVSKKSIRALWIAYGFLATPVVAACVKILFFGAS